jgi:hypothetical protein
METKERRDARVPKAVTVGAENTVAATANWPDRFQFSVVTLSIAVADVEDETATRASRQKYILLDNGGLLVRCCARQRDVHRPSSEVVMLVTAATDVSSRFVRLVCCTPRCPMSAP